MRNLKTMNVRLPVWKQLNRVVGKMKDRAPEQKQVSMVSLATTGAKMVAEIVNSVPEGVEANEVIAQLEEAFEKFAVVQSESPLYQRVLDAFAIE